MLLDKVQKLILLLNDAKKVKNIVINKKWESKESAAILEYFKLYIYSDLRSMNNLVIIWIGLLGIKPIT